MAHPSSRFVFIPGLLLTLALLAPAPAALARAARPQEPQALVPVSFTDLAEAASPAVVNIRTEKSAQAQGGGQRFFGQPFGNKEPFGDQEPFRDFFDRFFGDQSPREFRSRSLGSGFIMDPEGFIVTNNHVVEGADSISVKLNNGKEYEAEVVGRDGKTDLALIRVHADEKLPHLSLGDSDALAVGQWVVAIGSPFGLEHTVTAGIVSAKGRVIGAGPYDDFIQTDASINPGNSGGPLLDLSGKVVGINTAIVAQGQGIGFAIPVNLAADILRQLKESGEVTRGWLGVAIQDVNQEIAEYYGAPGDKGALVSKVFPGDPADKAGLKPMDIILSVNGEKVETGRDLSRIIAGIAVGEKAAISVFREGKRETVTVVIARRDDEALSARVQEDEANGPAAESLFGMALTPLSPEKAQSLGVTDSEGLLVTEVEPDSKADRAGVSRGDVIVEANRQPVRTVGELKAQVDEGKSVFLFIHKRSGAWDAVKLEK
ncbi:MAG: Do family serine endopeptidase [Pseudomonadota bacterium]